MLGYHLYATALFVTGTILALVGGYAWRHRDVPGATPFAFTALALVFCTIVTALELGGDTLSFKLLWANLGFFAYVSVPPAWLIMALQYTGQGSHLTRPRLVGLFVIPLITLAMVWTNDLHGLIRTGVYLDSEGPFSVIGKSYGPWFWVHASYSYLVLMMAVVLLSGAAARSIAPYRAQAVALLAATLLPVLWNVIYVLGVSPFRRSDASVIVYSVSGLIVAWALFRSRLFALAPLTCENVIDVIPDAVVLLDAQRQVTAANPVARRILAPAGAEMLGADGVRLFAAWPEVAAMIGATAPCATEVTLVSKEGRRIFEARSSPANASGSQQSGQVLVLHDVTERRLAEEALRESERRYRELADALPQPVFEIDAQGHITFGNRAAFETFGCDPSDIAEGLSVAQMLAPHERLRGMNGIRRVMAGGVSGGEYLVQRGDGSTFPAIIYSSPMVEHGEVVGLRGMIVDISGRKRQEEQLAFLAAHDPLTGLPNRRALEQAVTRALTAAGEGAPGALLFIDLDNFKSVNDRMGHLAGDDVLMRIVREWRALLRADDLLARYGGDEFAVLLPGSDRASALQVAERLRDAVTRFDRGPGGPAVDLGLSVGLVTLDGQETLDEVLAQGDAAMYRAKELGGHRVVLHLV